MPLPKLAAPNYELTLPSNGKNVRYRPFLVKEEKVLMLASESENEKDIANAIKDIIKNCMFINLQIFKQRFFRIDFYT